MVTAMNGVAGAEHPVMRWGAVWAGWFLATGVAALLYVFGLAVGFSAVDLHSMAAVEHGLSSGAMVWIILTWGASLWLGAMFASWFDGRNDTEMGVIRGLCVWGLSVTATALLAGSGLTHLTAAVPVVPAEDLPSVDAAMVAKYTSRLMWTAFGCALLSLMAAALGGWLGAHHVHLVYHQRTYARHGDIR